MVGLVAYWLWAAHQFGTLPARLPMKFDGRGIPTRWETTSAVTWFGLPAVGLGLMVLLLGTTALITWLTRHKPALVNTLDRERWLRLSPQARERGIAPVVLAATASTPVLLGVFAYLSWGTQAVARAYAQRGGAQAGSGAASTSTLDMWPVMALVVLIMLLMLGGVAWSTWRLHCSPVDEVA